MQLLWLSLVAAGVIQVDTLQYSKSAPYVPRCWGPGIWPHPEHCRLFTICQLKYEVKGQLFACPADTGFSIKHLKCMPEAKVPGCRTSPPFSDQKLVESSAVKYSNVSVKPDHNLCYKRKTSTPFCMDDVTLVVCGPREAFMGTVDCSTQSQVITGRCDKDTKTCTLEPVPPQEDDEEHRPFLPSSSSPPLHGDHRPSPPPPSSHIEDHQPSPSVTLSSTPSPLDEDHYPTPLHFEDLHNITAALLEEIANSNLTLFDKDKYNESSTSPGEDNMITTSEAPQPTLPSTSEISCKVSGLQCYDNVTIMDCPDDDDTEPNFVMSCSNIIQTAENATGYCNPENPSCVLLIENFMLNMEISSFNFGDSNNNNQDLGFAEMDEDYEGPELYDSDNLRESPDDIFDGLSWFRHEPKGSRDVDSPEEYSLIRRGKDVSKVGTELSENQKEKDPKETFGKFESQAALDKAFHADLLRKIKSATLGGVQHGSSRRDGKSLRDLPIPPQKIKRAQTIEAQPEAREVFEKFLAKCEQGGLFCYDNTTLVACSEDADSQTYAVQCYGEATSPNGRRLEAYCDQTTDSCVVNVQDARGEDTMTRNVDVVDTPGRVTTSRRGAR